MTTRRTFLMTSLGAAAVGTVTLITVALGKSRLSGQGVPANAVEPVQPAGQAATQPAKRVGAASKPAEAQSGVIVIIPRRDWGAAEPAVTPDGSGEHGPYDATTNPNGWLVYDQPLADILNTIVIHHSALPLTDGPLEIQRLHTEQKGFADIGYHFLVDEKGKLYEGRAMNVRGAHTYGANYGSVGICLIGNFEEIQPTELQLLTAKSLIATLISQYPGITRLAGHRDFNPGTTLCPGANLYALLPDICQELNLNYGV